jgi:hypothetical protein
LKTLVKYKVSVSFQGTAVVEMEAETPEAARIVAAEMTVDDLARKSHSDISTLKIAAKEIIPLSAISGQGEESAEENAPRKPRPSGWYRPH